MEKYSQTYRHVIVHTARVILDIESVKCQGHPPAHGDTNHPGTQAVVGVLSGEVGGGESPGTGGELSPAFCGKKVTKRSNKIVWKGR